eukprot:16769-Heterococcus_DN1.PRE.5
MGPARSLLTTSQSEQPDLSVTLCAKYRQLTGSTATTCSHRLLVKPHTLLLQHTPRATVSSRRHDTTPLS